MAKLYTNPAETEFVTIEEVQEVSDAFEGMLLDYDQHRAKHYLGVSANHPAAPRVILTARKLLEWAIHNALEDAVDRGQSE